MPDWNLKSNWPGVLIFGFALGVFCWVVGLGWSNPPTDSHAGRQTQTAITAQLLHENGLSPLTPFNGLGPPWNIPMEFPTYQIATATLANFTGGDIITAGRLTAVLGALLVLPAMWLLLGRLQLSPNERLFICALLFSSPLWLHFSRSILIETWATSLALWWLAALVESLHQPDNRRWLITAVIIGILAALTKVTSFAVVLPVGALVTWLLPKRTFLKRLPVSALATLPGILAAVFWTRQSDAIKHAHPFADFLTSENLRTWNWGTLAQRLSPEWWQRWAEHLTQVLSIGLYVLVAIGLVKGTSNIRFGIGAALLAAITGPLAFANLYYVHNYYFIAVAPALAIAVGLGVVSLSRMLMSKRWGKILITAGLTGIICLQAHAFLNGFGHGQTLDRPLPEFGKLLREISTPRDNIAIIGREWDPLLTYTTNRKML
ncbi:hypothetical protein N9023_07585, partial [Opitutaceae bacterium]|nr:hypothetical protein [Opitutaceae bacterium]